MNRERWVSGCECEIPKRASSACSPIDAAFEGYDSLWWKCQSFNQLWKGQGKWLLEAITCKHGDLINVMKLAKVFTVEASPKIRDQDLSPLI